MRNDTNQPVLFGSISSKSVEVAFDAPAQSSDGGLPLLAALDRKLGLTALLSATFIDRRRSKSVDHTITDLVRQRVYSIALGYADCNDAARVGTDPIFKLACDRSPNATSELASQPTLSRFERGQGGREVVAMGRALERAVIDQLARQHRGARRITIDLDGSEDPTHGQQPFAFFNGYYDKWCYVPLFGFLSIDDLPEQHLFFARLRPGTGPEERCVRTLLRRVVPLLRERFRRAEIIVRLDAGFASSELFDVLDELRVSYAVAMAKNKVLSHHANLHMMAVRSVTEVLGGTSTVFGECKYRAGSWTRARRVIFKAEVVTHPDREPRDNLRFVVTNLRDEAGSLWRRYTQRGDVENRIKELKLDLQVDRTSSTSFLANQVRVLLTAAAFVLFQQLRNRLGSTGLSRATVGTLRLKLLKVGATVRETWRRIVIALPTSYPWKDMWRMAAIASGAH